MRNIIWIILIVIVSCEQNTSFHNNKSGGLSEMAVSADSLSYGYFDSLPDFDVKGILAQFYKTDIKTESYVDFDVESLLVELQKKGFKIKIDTLHSNDYGFQVPFIKGGENRYVGLPVPVESLCVIGRKDNGDYLSYKIQRYEKTVALLGIKHIIDRVCANDPAFPHVHGKSTFFRKTFRGYGVYKNHLVILSHQLFRPDQRNSYKELRLICKDTNECWIEYYLPK